MKFDFRCTQSELLEKTLEFTVFSVHHFKNQQVGSFRVSLHMVHKKTSSSKWIILSSSMGEVTVRPCKAMNYRFQVYNINRAISK